MADSIEILYARIRSEEAAARRRRIDEAYRVSPRLMELDALRTGLIAEAGNKKITLAESRERLAAVALEEQSILRNLGLPGDALELRYRCPACKDTGFVGDALKSPCACRLRYQQAALQGEGVNERETFAAFSESVYKDEPERVRAIKVKTLCMAYAAALPRPEKPNLLLTGMPGLGKSYLGNAIAFEAINRGIDSKKVTAYHFVQDMLSDIRERTNNACRYQYVPLLVLDDLGSEPDIPNVSKEWLFTILNERTQTRRTTVCITNLSLMQLQQRYGERIMSRMADKSITIAIELTGSNLRFR